MAETKFTDREVLEIFIESVDEMLQSDFLSEAKATGIATQFNWSKETGFLGERTGPQRDAVKAFLLTLRFFRQNNEATSLCNMEQRIASLEIDAELKEQFRKSRYEFNSYLDRVPSVGFPKGIGADSRRDVFETFLYGLFAHANPEKRRRVLQWEHKPFFDDIRAQFDLILLEWLKALSAMAQVCRIAIKGLLA